MITVYSNDHLLHNPLREFDSGILTWPYDVPKRVAVLLEAVEQASLGPIQPAREFGLEHVQAVHSEAYIRFMETAYQRWVEAGGDPGAVLPSTFAMRWMNRTCDHPLAAPGYYFFDSSAPVVSGTYKAAISAVNVALTGASLLCEGEKAVYSLCRPPGHHAGYDLGGGYCYFNNAAIAAEYLLRTNPNIKRVAILDIDLHHGNGTQQIFYSRSDVLFVSIHIDPANGYPYFSGYADERGSDDGMGYNVNIPLEEGTTNGVYLSALDQALEFIAEKSCQCLIVSTGFDTYAQDPIGAFKLTTDVYPVIGSRIASISLPTLFILEGGYAVDILGSLAVGLLGGFENKI